MVYIRDEDKAEIEHVRRPGLPWRPSTLTECGIPSEGHPCISREDFFAKLKKQGQQRSAMTTCMTCWDTAQRHPSWDEDPISSMAREIESYRRWKYAKREPYPFLSELKAIAILIERHRPEFDELVEDQQEIVPINSQKDPRQ